jgi:hypothetical protein
MPEENTPPSRRSFEEVIHDLVQSQAQEGSLTRKALGITLAAPTAAITGIGSLIGNKIKEWHAGFSKMGVTQMAVATGKSVANAYRLIAGVEIPSVEQEQTKEEKDAERADSQKDLLKSVKDDTGALVGFAEKELGISRAELELAEEADRESDRKMPGVVVPIRPDAEFDTGDGKPDAEGISASGVGKALAGIGMVGMMSYLGWEENAFTGLTQGVKRMGTEFTKSITKIKGWGTRVGTFVDDIGKSATKFGSRVGTIVDDIAKKGATFLTKVGLRKAGGEVVEEIVEEGSEKVVKKATTKAISTIAKEGGEEVVKKTAIKTAGKVALKVVSKAAAPVAAIVEGGMDAKEQAENIQIIRDAALRGEVTPEELEQAESDYKASIAGSVGTGGGALGGALAGAAIGASIGTVVPIVGNIVGGFIGAVAGGIIGGWGGNKAGDLVGEAITGVESGSQARLQDLAARVKQGAEAVIDEAGAEGELDTDGDGLQQDGDLVVTTPKITTDVQEVEILRIRRQELEDQTEKSVVAATVNAPITTVTTGGSTQTTTVTNINRPDSLEEDATVVG